MSQLPADPKDLLVEKRREIDEFIQNLVKLGMQVLISVFAFGTGVYFILRATEGPAVKEFGASLIGLVVGYWLK